LQIWRWQGGPAKVPPLATATGAGEKARSRTKKAEEGAVSAIPQDLRSRIVAELETHGEVAPGALKRRMGLSHAPVYRALQILMADGVVEVRGKTRGLRYRLTNDWKAAFDRVPSSSRTSKRPFLSEQTTIN